MRRISTTLLSIGLSAALIALGIWYLASHLGVFRFGRGGLIPHGMLMGGSMGGAVMILFWIVLVAALVLLVSSLLTGRGDAADVAGREPDALEILKRRYARGDIDRSEYETKRRELAG